MVVVVVVWVVEGRIFDKGKKVKKKQRNKAKKRMIIAIVIKRYREQKSTYRFRA